MNVKRYFCALFFLLCLCCVPWGNVHAFSEAEWREMEKKIGKEIYIPNIRLVYYDALPERLGERLKSLGVMLAYVNELSRPGGGKYTCSPLSSDGLMKAAFIVSKAFEKLSVDTMNKIKLKYVLLCNETTAGSKRIGGIPIPPLKLLMLGLGRVEKMRTERTFFHELFHYMEYIVRGSIYDPEWRKRFGTGYMNSYRNLSEKGITVLGSGDKGFINKYAQFLPEEDRAEVFEYLMYDPKGLREYVAKTQDAVLHKKIMYIQEISEKLFGIHYPKLYSR